MFALKSRTCLGGYYTLLIELDQLEGFDIKLSIWKDWDGQTLSPLRRIPFALKVLFNCYLEPSFFDCTPEEGKQIGEKILEMATNLDPAYGYADKDCLPPWFQCNCWSHVLRMGIDLDPEYNYVEFNILSTCTERELAQRCREAWHVLTTGRPFTDRVCFCKPTAEQLGKYLIQECSR